ncbi:DUF1372 family protein [Streptococcus orisratti]|uniref:DUF1372 family protein n=1 Tax=Streptococcus orisratti TaxID=114652 RepID=UPI003D037877
MSSYDVILVVTVVAVLLVCYLEYELFIHYANKMPLLVTIVLLIIVVQAKDYSMEMTKQVDKLEARKTIVIYNVDNAGAAMVGKITNKQVIDRHYTVTVDGYGNFLVTREQYEAINIGDEIPEYLKGGE